MNTAFTELRDAGVSVTASCELIGRSRATHYRHTRPPVQGPKRPRPAPANGQALSAVERAAVLELINRPGICGPGDTAGLGPRARRGQLYLLGLEHVSDRPGRRAGA